jgi:hypothetical protein
VREGRDLAVVRERAWRQLQQRVELLRRSGELDDVRETEAEMRRLENADEETVLDVIRDQNLIVEDANGPRSGRTQRRENEIDWSSARTSEEDTRYEGDRRTTTRSENEVEANAYAGNVAATQRDSRIESDGVRERTDVTETRSQASVRDGRMTVSNRTAVRSSDRATSSEHRENDTSSEASAEGSASLINDETSTGAAAAHTAEASAEHGGTRISGRTSTDGAFRVTVTEVPASDPPQFRVMLEVAATLSASGTLRGRRGGTEEGANRAHASATAGASFSGAVRYTHVMTEAEAREYLGDLDQLDATNQSGDRPEHTMIQRVRAGSGVGDRGASAAAAAFGDPEAARELGEGDSMELDLSAGVNGRLEAGGSGRLDPELNQSGFGANVHVAGDARWTQVVRISRVSPNIVDITVTFTERMNGEIGGGINASLANGGISERRGSSEGRAATFRLDQTAATYAATYRRLCGMDSPDELDARDLLPFRRETTDSDEDSGGRDINAGVGPVQVQAGQANSYREDVHTEADGDQRGRVEGTHDQTASLSVGDLAVLQDERRDRTVANVNREGELNVDFESRDTSGNAFAQLDNVVEELDLGLEAPGEQLEEALEETDVTEENTELASADVIALTQRARDLRRWEACCNVISVRPAWLALRRALISPTPSSPESAANLARARALAEFEGRSNARECLDAALRYWPDAEGEDIGRQFQWPESLERTRQLYLATRDEIGEASHHLDGFADDADPVAAANRWRDRHARILRETRDAVTRSTEITNVGARASVVDSCSRLEQELRAAVDAFANRATGRQESKEAEGIRESVENTVETGRLVGVLLTFKQGERAAFARIRETIDDWNGISCEEETEELNRMESSIDAWIAKVQELRALYRELQIPESEWRVSTGPGAPRDPQTEPDVETRIQLHERTNPYTRPYAQWRRQASY